MTRRRSSTQLTAVNTEPVPTTSRSAGTRNAALRAATAEAFPTCRFAIRNGPKGSAAVSWTDGPTTAAVHQVLGTVPAPGGQRWATHQTRTLSPQLITVHYLRLRAAALPTGELTAGTRTDTGPGGPREPGTPPRWFAETTIDGSPVAPGDLRPRSTVRRSTAIFLTVDLDSDSIHPAERQLAAAVLATIPGPLPTDPFEQQETIAAAVYHFAGALQTALQAAH
jgi:hypothetical protein